MGNAVTVTANTAGFTGATATLRNNDNDTAGIVTFTTASTIPASPYKLFTIKWAGSWAVKYASTGPVINIFACPNVQDNARTQAQAAATAALGPFYCLPVSGGLTVDVYCTAAPATTTPYDIGYYAIEGPI